MNVRSQSTVTKDFRLDVLRVVAMIMVVFIHVANYYCRAYSEISSVSYLGAVIYNAVSRVSVPMFFMISGMLLLRRPVDLKKNTKRIVGKLVYLIIVTVVFLLWDIFYMGKTGINFWGLISTPERKLLWFMYAIIGLYIALPFIRRMVENMTKGEDILFVALWLTFNGVPHLLKFLVGANVSYPIPIINGTYYLGLFVFGYLIDKYRTEIADWFSKTPVKIVSTIVCLGSFFCTIFITYSGSLHKNGYYQYFLQYKSLFSLLASITFFLIVYTTCKNKESKIISTLANNSFEVYLFHGIALDFVMKNVEFTNFNAFFGVPILSVVIFVITFIGVVAVKWLISLFKSHK